MSASLQRRHDELIAQDGLPWRNLHLVHKIAAFDRKIGVPRQSHPQKQIAAFSTALAGLTLARKANALSFAHTTRNFYLIRFRFFRTGAAQRNLSRRTMQRFLQRDHDVGFDIAPALRHGTALSETAEGRPTTTAPEECFEKIAEPGPAELKFDTTVFPTAPAKSAGSPATPLRWRLKPAWLIPILAQLIVFPALLRIA